MITIHYDSNQQCLSVCLHAWTVVNIIHILFWERESQCHSLVMQDCADCGDSACLPGGHSQFCVKTVEPSFNTTLWKSLALDMWDLCLGFMKVIVLYSRTIISNLMGLVPIMRWRWRLMSWERRWQLVTWVEGGSWSCGTESGSCPVEQKVMVALLGHWSPVPCIWRISLSCISTMENKNDPKFVYLLSQFQSAIVHPAPWPKLLLVEWQHHL